MNLQAQLHSREGNAKATASSGMSGGSPGASLPRDGVKSYQTKAIHPEEQNLAKPDRTYSVTKGISKPNRMRFINPVIPF